jgi:AmiR/NasT family two-component response regulator
MTYGRHDEHVMRLLAAQAAILLANSQSLQAARRLSRQLTDALASRDTIALATGVLLARGAADREEAFARLAAIARGSDCSVEEVARALLAAVTPGGTGSVPDETGPRGP